MKNHKLNPLRLAIASLAAVPAIAMALPPTTSPYYTDNTNSYVQDQTSEVMGRLNGILCYMGAMAPDQMVNTGDANGNYIALVNSSVCEAKGSGGQSGNTGGAYEAMVVNSTRTAGQPMKVKVWVDQQGQTMPVYASATEAPTTANPYGVFSMNYCAGTACANQTGFINATASGLTFYSAEYQDATHQSETKLKLNATGSGSTAAGSGAISQTYTWDTFTGGSDFKFAYNAGYFVRNDSPSNAYDPTKDLCFDRSPANASESVWRYGLYNATDGTQITRNSGFPIEYTDTSVTPNVTANGYIGYYGLWTQGTGPASNTTVKKVTYSGNSANTTPYTLYKTGGKLMKYTTANKTLADLNKITFWYYAQTAIGTGIPSSGQYELYWDDTTKQFMVSGKQGATGDMNMETYPTPVAIDSTPSASNTAMLAANQWGLFGWSQMMGGMFGIKGDDFAALVTPTTPIPTPSDIPVKTQTQDVVYPNQLAALGSLTCINDCPTAALIASSNADTSGATSAFEPSTAGWTPVASSVFSTYTFDASGNLLDQASGVVVSTATSGTNANGIRSGRMLATADATEDYLAMIAAKNASGVCGGTCTQFNQGDVDFLPTGKSYYVWETGGQPWNQIAYLMSQDSTPVLQVFDAPLQVSYTVPANTVGNKPYGNFAGSTMTLQYGGFGDLWGIPNECVDITTNVACTFGTGGTAQSNQRWTSKFSIPFGGSVTADAGATTYLVKALDKEIRLAKVDCAGTSLSTSTVTSTGLPTSLDFVDPTATVGSKPTVTAAPQVIHGVKQY